VLRDEVLFILNIRNIFHNRNGYLAGAGGGASCNTRMYGRSLALAEIKNGLCTAEAVLVKRCMPARARAAA